MPDYYAIYISLLEETEQYDATALLYDGYMSGAEAFKTPQEAAVDSLSALLDKKVVDHTVELEDVADYEEAARCAGFYAGFRAAVAYRHFLRAAVKPIRKGVQE